MYTFVNLLLSRIVLGKHRRSSLLRSEGVVWKLLGSLCFIFPFHILQLVFSGIIILTMLHRSFLVYSPNFEEKKLKEAYYVTLLSVCLIIFFFFGVVLVVSKGSRQFEHFQNHKNEFPSYALALPEGQADTARESSKPEI
jgi:hypothetical protein